MRRFGLLGFLALGLLLNGGAARAADVDMALVLAVDVSASVNEERWNLQKQGYAEAFRNADVIGAIRNGRKGAIAVAFIEWAGWRQHIEVIDWTVIDGESATLVHGYSAMNSAGYS
jgi:hypothetical protein